eukprot:gnl/TRDRNA2_/TRDRNA2_81780_c0_seq1.p1 gnl/TRDRNA2_/TRDRNA2_81780_c0~~gnl/TRDRNA2_/TRDRNA2_81780_c0_seq1.p1  ORF type:complete len:196 (-),score=57.73 gnl/TRDRNA2_/TRDRNA2_81780_c0_seq1:40-627(-)
MFDFDDMMPEGDIEVLVWIHRELELSFTKKVPRGSKIGALKELIAKDDVTGGTTGQDLALCLADSPLGVLRDEELVPAQPLELCDKDWIPESPAATPEVSEAEPKVQSTLPREEANACKAMVTAVVQFSHAGQHWVHDFVVAEDCTIEALKVKMTAPEAISKFELHLLGRNVEHRELVADVVKDGSKLDFVYTGP